MLVCVFHRAVFEDVDFVFIQYGEASRARDEDNLLLRVPKGKDCAMPWGWGYMEKHQHQSGGRGNKGKTELLLRFPPEETSKQEKETLDWLVGMNSSEFWGGGAVSSYLAIGSGVIRAGK